MKISILEILEFLKTLDKNWYIEDEGILDEYMDEGWEKPLDPSAKVNVGKDEIWIMWQGESYKEHEDREFLKEFKAWKKGRTTVFITLEVDKSKLGEVTEVMKKLGVKIAK